MNIGTLGGSQGGGYNWRRCSERIGISRDRAQTGLWEVWEDKEVLQVGWALKGTIVASWRCKDVGSLVDQINTFC